MKYILLLTSLTLLGALNASAATYTAKSCSASDVQAAVNSASDGDTVLVPGGSCTWAVTVNVSKGITLNGQGTTTITMNETSSAGFGSLSVNADTTASTFVTGFTFIGSGVPGTAPAPIQANSSLSPLTRTYRIYNNTFDDGSPSASGVIIQASGLGSGLLDHNTLNIHHSGEEVIQVRGYSVSADPTPWSSDVAPGGPNMVFIEDNTFNAIGTITDTGAVNNYYGARVVIRHNQLNGGMTLDAHAGNLGANLTGTRWFEVYQNTYNIPSNNPNYHQATYAQLRGGSGVFWGNHSAGAPYQAPYPGYSFGPDTGSSDPQTGPWALIWQTGRGINQTYSPVYVWGNDSVMGAPGSANTTYVLIGSAPTDAQSCSAHPGNVCDAVFSSAQPATLLRCQSASDVTAGCPVSYSYTPYVYPHPLQGTKAAQSTAPAAPTNLSAVAQ